MNESGEFHVETGRAVEVLRGRAIVELDPAPNRGRRPECARCALCSAGRAAPEVPVELRAAVPPELNLSPGDRVEVRVRLSTPGRTRLVFLWLPLAAFLGTALAVHLAGKPWGVAAKIGFVALLGGYLALLAHDRARGARAEVSRKL